MEVFGRIMLDVSPNLPMIASSLPVQVIEPWLVLAAMSKAWAGRQPTA